MVNSGQSGIVLILLFIMLIVGGVALGLLFDVRSIPEVEAAWQFFLTRILPLLRGKGF